MEFFKSKFMLDHRFLIFPKTKLNKNYGRENILERKSCWNFFRGRLNKERNSFFLAIHQSIEFTNLLFLSSGCLFVERIIRKRKAIRLITTVSTCSFRENWFILSRRCILDFTQSILRTMRCNSHLRSRESNFSSLLV